MRRPVIVLFVALIAAVTLAVSLAAQQPRITNARLTAQAAGSPFPQSFRAIVSAQTEVAWIGYTVPVFNRQQVMCCFISTTGNGFMSGNIVMSDSTGWSPAVCGIEPYNTERRPAQATQGPVKLEGSERMSVLFRVSEGRIDRIRTFSEDCELDAGGRPVIWLDGVRPADSLALLESLVVPDPDRKERVSNGALSAIGNHQDAAAGALLERFARRHDSTTVRGEALFWIGQRSDRNAEGVILEALDKDPSPAVRKKAVFALSQLKDERGVPALIRTARNNSEPSTRGEAVFWLAQKAGQKAAAAITERIDEDPDTEVKKRAVFALSQLPKDEGVPLLIKVARTNTNPVVRKQAMFWLGQSKDPRAVEFFAEILK
jgi:HEAT repeats